MDLKHPFRTGILATLGVGVGLLILTSIASLSLILIYIGTALFLALGIEPLIYFLEKHNIPRWIALTSTLFILLALFGSIVWAIVPIAVDQASQLIQNIFGWVDSGDAEKWFLSLQDQFPTIVNQQTFDAITHWVQNNIFDITKILLQTSAGVLGGFFGVLVVIILMIYFTASLPNLRKGAYLLFPSSQREQFSHIAEQMMSSVGKFVMGQLTLAFINGFLSLIFLSIIGARFTVLLASIAFLFSLIPLVGTITGSILITLTTLLSGGQTAIATGIYYIIYMQIEAYALSPRIMNRAVAVPSVVVIIAALAGGTLLGVLGAFIAVPIAASILLIVRQIFMPIQNKR